MALVYLDNTPLLLPCRLLVCLRNECVPVAFRMVDSAAGSAWRNFWYLYPVWLSSGMFFGLAQLGIFLRLGTGQVCFMSAPGGLSKWLVSVWRSSGMFLSAPGVFRGG